LQAEPNETFGELVNRKKNGQGCEEQFASMFHLCQRYDTDRTQSAATYKIRFR
jgi:hypothetical protein